MWSRIGKSINLYVLAALVTLIFSACGQSAKATTMHLIKTSGDVGVSDQAGNTVELIENMGLYSGYQISTMDESRAWIDLDRVKLVKMDAGSEADIHKNGRELELVVNTGSLYFHITEPLEENETLNIRSSTMVVGIRGTRGWVEVPDNERFSVSLLEGSVECAAFDLDTYGTDTWMIDEGLKAEFVCRNGEIEVEIEPLEADDIPAFVREEGLPPAYEKLLEQERDIEFPEGEDHDGEGADDEEMPESTPGGGIDNMFGAYVNEEGREASIATTFSISIEGKTELVISLDNWETAKYVVLEQEEENVYRGIGPRDTQVYWVVFDKAGMQITPLAAADDDYRRIAGYYRQTEIYIEETGERIPVSETENNQNISLENM